MRVLFGVRRREAPAAGPAVGTVGFTCPAAHGTLLVTCQPGAGSKSYVRAA